jgi:hypothetical protein
LLNTFYTDIQSTVAKWVAVAGHYPYLTFDMWSSKAMRGYMGVTIKFASPPPELSVVTMAVALRFVSREQGRRHTGERLADEMEDVLRAFEAQATTEVIEVESQ